MKRQREDRDRASQRECESEIGRNCIKVKEKLRCFKDTSYTTLMYECMTIRLQCNSVYLSHRPYRSFKTPTFDPTPHPISVSKDYQSTTHII